MGRDIPTGGSNELECSECGRFILTPASHSTPCSHHPDAENNGNEDTGSGC